MSCGFPVGSHSFFWGRSPKVRKSESPVDGKLGSGGSLFASSQFPTAVGMLLRMTDVVGGGKCWLCQHRFITLLIVILRSIYNCRLLSATKDLTTVWMFGNI